MIFFWALLTYLTQTYVVPWNTKLVTEEENEVLALAVLDPVTETQRSRVRIRRVFQHKANMLAGKGVTLSA